MVLKAISRQELQRALLKDDLEQREFRRRAFARLRQLKAERCMVCLGSPCRCEDYDDAA